MRINNRSTLLYSLAGVGALLAGRSLLRARRAFDLDGKKVLITGGSRGLGLVMARQFVREGAQVALCARDAAELGRAHADLVHLGAQVPTFPCDITDKAQVDRLIHAVEGHFGRIDILVNNAGVIEVGPFEVMTIEDFEEAMRVHFWGPLYTTLAVLPGMCHRRSGRIVNISSLGGKVSVPHLLPYCASKFALAGFSEGLRAALAKDGIKVTTVCPGLMRTGSTHNAIFKGQHRAEYAWLNIIGALPFISMSAERAARQIIDACRRGDAEVVLSLPAKIVIQFHALFPGVTADLMALVNRLLPEPGGIGAARARGKDSRSALSPSVLTALNESAARRNNEVA